MNIEGSFTDERGSEPVTWLIADADLPGWAGRYLLSGTIRGARVRGIDFTSLEPDDPSPLLPLNRGGELDNCSLTASVVAKAGSGGPDGRLDLTLAVGAGNYAPVVDATLTFDEAAVATRREEVLSAVLEALVVQLDPQASWECCFTCGLSDYDPGGREFMGMRCHRDARDRYLASKGKREYWGVPVTENVPEFYWCDRFEVRRPGTGYRG